MDMVCERLSLRCIDDRYTWRNSLTIDKEYTVLRYLECKYSGQPMLEIMCDDGNIRTYRTDRFSRRNNDGHVW